MPKNYHRISCQLLELVKSKFFVGPYWASLHFLFLRNRYLRMSQFSIDLDSTVLCSWLLVAASEAYSIGQILFG